MNFKLNKYSDIYSKNIKTSVEFKHIYKSQCDNTEPGPEPGLEPGRET